MLTLPIVVLPCSAGVLCLKNLGLFNLPLKILTVNAQFQYMMEKKVVVKVFVI